VRVLFVSSGNSSSGINPIIRKQGESLIKLGVDLSFFPVSGKGLFSYLSAAIQLRRKLKTEHFDAVHAHYALCMYVAWYARRREKLVVSFMGTDLIGSNDDEGNFTRIGKVLSFIHVNFAKFFVESVIVKSSGMARIFGKSHRKLKVIPNGVDTKAFEPLDQRVSREKLGWDLEKQYVIFVSNPERVEKNFGLAERAVASLAKDNVRLVPVFKKNIEDLKYYYSAADVVLMTSFHEGSPNVVKEAMSCNCNLVCTDVGDVNELFGHLNNCWITTWDVQNVRNHLEIALGNDQSQNSSREYVLSIGLNEETIAARLKEIYST